MKTYGNVKALVHAFLAFALDGGARPVSRWENLSVPHWIGGLVNPKASLGTVEKRKMSRSCRKSNPKYLVVQPVA
jgi:hypothetical protein